MNVNGVKNKPQKFCGLFWKILFSFYDSLKLEILPYTLTRYSPHKPTRLYTILDRMVRSPNKKATRSNLKKPISPQFMAPMIAIVRAK